MHFQDLISQTARSKYDLFADTWTRLPGWAQAERHLAAELVQKIGFPTTRHELWRYTSLRPLLDQNFAFASPTLGVLTESQRAWVERKLIPGATTLVFIDGVLSTAFSKFYHSDVEIKSLADGQMHGDDVWWASLWNQRDFEDVFTQLTVMFASEGVYAKISGSGFFHILHVATAASKNKASTFRNVFHLLPGSNAQIIEEFSSIDEDPSTHLTLSLSQFVAEKNSQAQLVRLQTEHARAFHIGTTSIHLRGNAQVKHFSGVYGAKLSRTNIQAELTSESADLELDGLYWLDNEQLTDHMIFVNHRAPHTRSKQLYKGLMGGKSRGVFGGLIHIHADCSQAEAYQTNKNIILSDDAEAYTRPQLLIDTDDVKASHGATVGSLNPEDLFYLQSRGIDQQEAEWVLAHAFARDVMNHAGDLRSLLESRLSELHS